MKCIVCDKNEAVDHGQCLECLSKSLQISVTGSIDITICPKCDSYKIGNRWHRSAMKANLASKIEKHISSGETGTELRVVADSIEIQRTEGRIDFLVTADYKNLVSQPRNLSIPGKILLNSCPTCNKITGSYYEAIIQMRTLDAEYSPIIDSAMDLIDPFLVNMESSSNDSFVSKIVRLKEGLDLYIGKKNDALKISKFLHDNFFSEIKTTKKLAGRKEGEDFYRYTYLVRLMNLKAGTLMYHNGVTYILETATANTLKLIDASSERRLDVQQNDFYSGSYTYSSEVVPLRKYIVLASGNDETQIMDSVTFTTHFVKGSFSGEVSAFDYNGKFIVKRN